ncbi:MAG: ion transporter [Turicibacter sp.]|nr:ion transporter [Turicibacter sp.]
MARDRIYRIFLSEKDKHLSALIFEWGIIALVVLSVLSVFVDTFEGIPLAVAWASLYLDYFSVIVFTIEYALRVWTAPCRFPSLSPKKARLKYIFSFMAMADLLAILPFYIPFLISVDLRVLRLFRLLRILRMLKINRYTDALATVSRVVKAKVNQLVSSMFVMLILLVIASLLVYYFENPAQPEVFRNAFSGLWWAIVTLTTVGYGDIYPITASGKVLSAIVSILGIGFVAIPTGIISSGFVENINQTRDEEVAHQRAVKISSLIKEYDQLNEAGRRKILDYADDLINSGKYKEPDDTE